MSQIRRLRPWSRWLDRGTRAAHVRHLHSLNFQVVDYTDGGIAVKMPVELVPQWEAMPAETRAEFMADVDRQHFGEGDINQLHDWRSS